MRLLLHWDPEIDHDFRRAFERALEQLRIDFDDASAIDDPDEASVKLIVTTPAAAREMKDGLQVVAGAADGDTRGVLRLEASDIHDGTRRWIGVVETLARHLDRRALGPYVAAGGDLDRLKTWALEYPADPLAETVSAEFDTAELRARLAAQTARADAAESRLRAHERWLNDLKRGEGHAVGLKREAEIEAAGLRADLAEAHARLADALAMLESTAYPPSRIPPDLRDSCLLARREAGLARVMAERADSIASEAPDTLTWTQARYTGETRNRRPDGLGVMIYLDGRREVGRYRGQFAAGHRSGLGVGESDGLTWSGRWMNDDAHGPGVLDAADGRRFEGEVASIEGEVRRRHGHLWRALGPVLRHRPAPAELKQLAQPS